MHAARIKGLITDACLQRRPYFRTIATTTSTPALPTKGVKAQEVTGGRAGGDAVSLTSVYW